MNAFPVADRRVVRRRRPISGVWAGSRWENVGVPYERFDSNFILQYVETFDDQGRMRAGALPHVDGPAIVCTQAGNVNSGAFDPIGAVCDSIASP